MLEPQFVEIYFINQIYQIFDQRVFPNIPAFAILISGPGAAIIDISVDIAVLLLFVFFLGGHA